MAEWSPDYTCREVPYTRKEDWNFEAPQATVVLQVEADEAVLIMYDLLQNRREWPIPPPDDPTNPGFPLPLPKLRVSAVTISTDKAKWIGVAPEEERIEYLNSSFLIVMYKPLKGLIYPPEPNLQELECNDLLYAEEVFEPNVEFLTTDIRDFKWGDGEPVKRGLEQAVIIRGAALTRTVHGYSALPFRLGPSPDNWLKWLGKTHCKDYLSELNGREFLADTLLFTNPRVSYDYYNLRGGLDTRGCTFSISVRLLYKEEGWNKWWRNKADGIGGDASGFEAVYIMEDSGQSTRFEPTKRENMMQFIFNSTDRAQYCEFGLADCT